MHDSEGPAARLDELPGLPVHHIGIAVRSIEQTAPVIELLTGAGSSPIERVESQDVRVCFVGSLELIEPLSDHGGVSRFLDRRGPGLHHVAFATADIESELRRLENDGFRLIDREPRPGAHGHRVAFLHPRSTAGVLVELVEEPV